MPLILSSISGPGPGRNTKGRLPLMKKTQDGALLGRFLSYSFLEPPQTNELNCGKVPSHLIAEQRKFENSQTGEKQGLVHTARARIRFICENKVICKCTFIANHLKAVSRSYVDTELWQETENSVSSPSLATVYLLTTGMSHPPQASDSSSFHKYLSPCPSLTLSVPLSFLSQ